MNQPLVLFRCDGTPQTGLGHASRTLALAEAFIDIGCRCSFLGHFAAPVQRLLKCADMQWDALRAESWSADDAELLTRMAAQTGACGIVLDSYMLDADYVERVEREAAPVLLVDDFAALPRYRCSAVLNFTSRAEEFAYPRESVRCFLGPSWFLGRRRLRELRARGPRRLQDVRHVLVTPGGNDPYDITLPVLESLLSCRRRPLSVHVLAPVGHPARPALEAMLAASEEATVTLRAQLPDLAAELAWADLSISSAGLTKYEAAYLGIPSGVLSQNEGQARDTSCFEMLGMTVDLGPASHIERAVLDRQLCRLMEDRILRESLQQHGLTVFPQDPTRDLARELLAQVFGCG